MVLELLTPAAIAFGFGLLGGIVGYRVQHILGKRLVLSEKVLTSKITLYEEISHSSISLWDDIAAFYSAYKNNNSDKEKQKYGDVCVVSLKKYFSSFGKLMMYSNSDTYRKANEILGSTTNMLDLIVSMNQVNILANSQRVDELLRKSQLDINQMILLFRQDLKIDTVKFGDNILWNLNR